MKFSDIEQENWDELKPYLDTCLIPVSGLSGMESPWEAASKLEYLRDALDVLEIPFKGRVVTYPAVHYIPEGFSAGTSFLEQICTNLKNTGFRYVVIITAKSEIELPFEGGTADLILRITPSELQSDAAAKAKAEESIKNLWNGK